jgi:hypothetical protein
VRGKLKLFPCLTGYYLDDEHAALLNLLETFFKFVRKFCNFIQRDLKDSSEILEVFYLHGDRRAVSVYLDLGHDLLICCSRLYRFNLGPAVTVDDGAAWRVFEMREVLLELLSHVQVALQLSEMLCVLVLLLVLQHHRLQAFFGSLWLMLRFGGTLT